ncbi:MAG: ferrochelatase [Deltaproteobacteria bacterium]|nr:ferrochelatase [Deltaproteobacteria bacterium]
MPRVGLLLVNLGTPERPDPAAVRAYLKEFLSDPRVFDLPAWKRWLILNLFILPRRPKLSAHAYRAIWTERGSPLLVHGQDLAAKVQARLGEAVQVELAMRYGQPSIPAALERLTASGIDRIVVFPLYPQHASATTGSSLQAVFEALGRLWTIPSLQVVPAFHDHDAFISAFAGVARPVLDAARPERVLFSFHGLPERHLRKADPAGTHCLKDARCCAELGPANASCYRAQCFATAARLGERLGLSPEQRVVSFQSRLGREVWIRPYTEEVLTALAKEGVRRLAVLSPAFVADCLETLEELGLRGAETFRAAGGEELTLVSSLNAHDAWADAVVTIAREHASWLKDAGPAPA